MKFLKPLLVCIVGATGIGKTALSIKIAKAFSTEIISADSRQFYKEMRIGTAVPSIKELAEVPHHFIQNKSIHDEYSVGNYEKEAISCIENLFTKHAILVLVGGSGLYVDAIINSLDEFPKVDSSFREALNLQLKNLGIKSLQDELEKLDSDYFKTVDINNAHRLIRALEICKGSGKPYSSFLKKQHITRSFNVLKIGITAERELIYNRINKRVDKMMDEGLLEEARNLHKYKALNALQTVGYKEMFDFFDDKISLEKAVEEIKKNTRRFAKRQGTWHRKDEEINWFDYKTKPTAIIDFIKK